MTFVRISLQAFARVVPSSHLNQLKGERVKIAAFDDSKDFNEVKQSEDFIDYYDFSESDESPEQSRNDPSESGGSSSTTSMPIFLQEDQEMRFRYALSQVFHWIFNFNAWHCLIKASIYTDSAAASFRV